MLKKGNSSSNICFSPQFTIIFRHLLKFRNKNSLRKRLSAVATKAFMALLSKLVVSALFCHFSVFWKARTPFAQPLHNTNNNNNNTRNNNEVASAAASGGRQAGFCIFIRLKLKRCGSLAKTLASL